MTVVDRRLSIIVAPAALALRCLLFLAVGAFGMGGPVLSQERNPLQLGDLPQAVPEPRRDILILRSGGYEEGELTGCSSESCSLGGKSHRRDDIVLIGLGIGGSDPAPAIDDPLQDTIHLRSAAVLKAKLLGINTQTVVSCQGSNPRREVAWVYLAPPQPAPPDHAGRPIDPAAPERAEKPKIGKDPPPPPPSVSETRQPTPPSGLGYRPPAAVGASGEPRSYVWDGQIEVKYASDGTVGWHAHRRKWRAIYLVKFLEKWKKRSASVQDLSGQSFRINEIVPLEMNYTIQADDHEWHITRRTEDVIMRGQAGGKMTGDELKNMLRGRILRFEALAGTIIAARRTQPQFFASWKEFKEFEGRFNTVHRPGCYWINVAFSSGTAAEQRQRYLGINRSGSLPIRPDPDRDFLRFVPAFMPGGTNVYGCLEGPEQGEVRGELLFPYGDPLPGLNSPQVSIKWSFARCPEGMTCARPRVSDAAAPQSPPDLCPDPKIQAALLQRGLDEQRRIKERLDAQRRAYDALVRQAEQWKNDFTHASRDCSLWSAALTLTGFLAGRGPTTKGGNPGEAFNNFLNLIDKVSVGDPSWMLPDVESDMLPSVETAWDAFRAGYDALGPAAPEKMLYDLRMCGAPTIDDVMDGAITYVRLLQQIEPIMQDVRKTLNDLRAKDNELLNLWSDYHRACLEYAKCKKLPASMCDRVPAAP